jgi:hypothetical protein
MIFYIFGHNDLKVTDFMKFYAPVLDELLDNPEHYFLVGDSDGCDALAQSYLKHKLDEEGQRRVKVFHKGEKPTNYLSVNFFSVPGFSNDIEASVAMTLCSQEDIAVCKESRINSFVAKALLRRRCPDFDYKAVAEGVNSNKEFWKILKAEE